MQETTPLFCTISLFISWITGRISKKMPWFENYLIPIQNMLIGISIAVIEWFFTHDFNLAIAVSGIAAGGIYDVFHNLNIILKMLINKEEENKEKE